MTIILQAEIFPLAGGSSVFFISHNEFSTCYPESLTKLSNYETLSSAYSPPQNPSTAPLKVQASQGIPPRNFSIWLKSALNFLPPPNLNSLLLPGHLTHLAQLKQDSKIWACLNCHPLLCA